MAVKARRERSRSRVQPVSSVVPQRVLYDPQIHQPIIRRGFLCRVPDAEIAEWCGVSEQKFREWLETFPELAPMRAQARNRLAEVVDAMFDKAIGWVDEHGRRQGASVEAQKFVLGVAGLSPDSRRDKASGAKGKSRHRQDLDELTHEELAAVGRRLLDSMSKQAGHSNLEEESVFQ